MAPPRKRPGPSSSACDPCRKARVKCATQPGQFCDRCTKFNRTHLCVYSSETGAQLRKALKASRGPSDYNPDLQSPAPETTTAEQPALDNMLYTPNNDATFPFYYQNTAYPYPYLPTILSMPSPTSLAALPLPEPIAPKADLSTSVHSPPSQQSQLRLEPEAVTPRKRKRKEIKPVLLAAASLVPPESKDLAAIGEKPAIAIDTSGPVTRKRKKPEKGEEAELLLNFMHQNSPEEPTSKLPTPKRLESSLPQEETPTHPSYPPQRSPSTSMSGSSQASSSFSTYINL